jgi:hypothetical protein
MDKKVNQKKRTTLNPKREPLDVQSFKEQTGCHEMTDEEAKEIVYSLKMIASIIVDFQYEMELKSKIYNDETEFKQAA